MRLAFAVFVAFSGRAVTPHERTFFVVWPPCPTDKSPDITKLHLLNGPLEICAIHSANEAT